MSAVLLVLLNFPIVPRQGVRRLIWSYKKRAIKYMYRQNKLCNSLESTKLILMKVFTGLLIWKITTLKTNQCILTRGVFEHLQPTWEVTQVNYKIWYFLLSSATHIWFVSASNHFSQATLTNCVTMQYKGQLRHKSAKFCILANY